MIEQNFGTIATLEFAASPLHGFEDIVEEVDISFQPVGTVRRSVIRDSEDIASIERDNLRVTLGWLSPSDEDGSYYLVVAVGPTRDHGNIHITPETCGFVKDTLIDHLASYLSFNTVFHAEATQRVGAELVDTVTDILRCDYDARPAPRLGDAHHPFQPLPDSEELWDANMAYADPSEMQLEPECSLPQRLTIYTLGATMLLYTPPVGASLLIYSTLRDILPAGRQQPALQH